MFELELMVENSHSRFNPEHQQNSPQNNHYLKHKFIVMVIICKAGLEDEKG